MSFMIIPQGEGPTAAPTPTPQRGDKEWPLPQVLRAVVQQDGQYPSRSWLRLEFSDGSRQTTRHETKYSIRLARLLTGEAPGQSHFTQRYDPPLGPPNPETPLPPAGPEVEYLPSLQLKGGKRG